MTIMQGGHKPFSYVAISFSPRNSVVRRLNIICCALDFVWSGLCFFAYGKPMGLLVVCVSLNLVTCVFFI